MSAGEGWASGDEPRDEHGPEQEPFRERLIEAAFEAELETGRHEETIQEARTSIHRRLARMVVGFSLLILGAILLILPGPGWLCIAAGLGILARDVAWAERLLERVRRRLPQDGDGKVSKPVIVTSVVLALAGIAFSLWLWLT